MQQLDAIRTLHEAFTHADVAYWLFGGWAVDFHAGRVTRSHSDVDIAVWLADLEAVRRNLDETGWRAVSDRPGDGFLTFERGSVRVDIALLERDPSGAIYTPSDRGRGEWPVDSFGTARASLLGADAHVVDRAALIADKSEPHGPDADAEDEVDLAVLESLEDPP